MLPVLRDYQTDDLGEVRVAFRSHRSVVLVEPTGAGKGTEASYIVHNVIEGGRRVLFLVNRRNLVHDMSDRVTRLGIDHGVIMGNDPRTRPDLKAHIASIQTVHRRQKRPKADLIIVDEAHFAVSKMWKDVLDSFPEAKILGLTATPIRADGRGLGEVFEHMVVGPSTQQLIDWKYLVPARVFRPAGAPKLEDLPKIDNLQQLAALCNKPKLVGDLVKTYQAMGQNRKSVAFGVVQDHAHRIAESFRCAGIEFAYVGDDTPETERKKIWYDYDHGNLRGIASVGVISYGWDHSICSCIIGARATNAMGLWRQMLGRGGRPHPGKEDFFVFDHFDNTGRLNALFEDDVQWQLHGNAIRETPGEKVVSVTTCRKCFATFRANPGIRTCPYCFAEIPKHQIPIPRAKGELEEMEREKKARAIDAWAGKQGDDKRRAKFEEFRQLARERNYKASWATVKFKVIFGHYPPREWMR